MQCRNLHRNKVECNFKARRIARSYCVHIGRIVEHETIAFCATHIFQLKITITERQLKRRIN